jgi:hypothetical protein
VFLTKRTVCVHDGLCRFNKCSPDKLFEIFSQIVALVGCRWLGRRSTFWRLRSASISTPTVHTHAEVDRIGNDTLLCRLPICYPRSGSNPHISSSSQARPIGGQARKGGYLSMVGLALPPSACRDSPGIYRRKRKSPGVYLFSIDLDNVCPMRLAYICNQHGSDHEHLRRDCVHGA